MPKQTLNYKLGYFVPGEFTDQTTEANRWNTIDIQLRGLYEVLGNGVLEGWNILASSTDPFSIEISAGKSVISFVSCASIDSFLLGSLLPSQVNYIYATLTNTTYWDQSVAFNSFLNGGDKDNAIFIGTVTTDEEGITNIDINDRSNISLFASVSNLISQHKHIGGADSPEPVDLSAEVQGKIGQANLPDLDTSIIKSGVLDTDRIPQINHNILKNKGSLTHPQLDSFINVLLSQKNTLMGETVLVDFLQLILSLKHQWPEIDEYLINELAFIPGISPNSIIDTANTTANVDTRTYLEGGEHTISGHPGPGMEVFTKTFDTEEELNESEKSGTYVVGNSVILKTTEIKVLIEDFENVSDWKTSIVDLSSSSGSFVRDAEAFIQGQYSGKINLNIDTKTNVAFVLEKSFQSQDWSKYNKIVFFLRTEGVEHGDMYFYLNDGAYGSQESFTMVLERGAPTINRDTLMVGWREIVVDISKFKRQAITSIGFYTSTRSGWDASKSLTLNMDDVYITRGNEFLDNGYVRFIYGDETYKNFWKIRWDSLNPSGITLKVRTRLANDSTSLLSGVWSSYSTVSGFEISNLTGDLYKYIQIEVYMESSSDDKFSPELMKLYLDTYISSQESQFTFNKKEHWESGTLINADVSSQPGKLLVKNIGEINKFLYSSQNKVFKADENCEVILEISGTSLPKTTNQVLNNTSPSFGQISAVENGNNNTYWVVDTDNDRVVQIDQSGKLIYGLYGSFLKEPTDYYGTEERGPGSNVDYASLTQDAYENELDVLHSIYNSNDKKLSIIFNRPLTPLHTGENTLSFNKIFLKSGSYRFYFDENTPISLFGIDGEKYNSWIGSTNKFLNQFNFNSHILQLTLTQADAVTLASIVDFSIPSIIAVGPTQNEMVTENYVTLKFIVNNITIGGSDEYKIRIKVDNGTYYYFETTNILLEGLTEEYHIVEASIVDKNNNVLRNQESTINLKFIVNLSGSDNEPRILITNPKQNQNFSSSPIQISFVVYNYSILPVGGHIRYSIDSGYWREHRTSDPIVIDKVSSGYHHIDIFLADEYGQQISSPYARTFVECYVGVSSLSDLKLILDSNAILAKPNTQSTTTTAQENLGNKEASTPIDVGNIYISNIYSPIDIQYLIGETSKLNPYGLDSILVSKLRSSSSTYYLSKTSIPTIASETLVGVSPKDMAIFGSKYMDGHSVVQLNSINGQMFFSNNAAKFAENRSNVKKILGSARKIASNKILIADSLRKRAIITHTNFDNKDVFVAWEYNSPRYVVDAQPIKIEEKNIEVNQTSSNPAELIITQGDTVIWTNNSLSSITIYSGNTTLEQFTADPDLTLYGNDFVSQELKPSEQFSFIFNNLGTFSWFAYPAIITGVIYISASGISSDDQYLLVENDMSSSSFGSRIIKVNSWGKIVWSFGEGYIVDPKDVRIIPDESSIVISV